MIKRMADEVDVPVAFNLDHGQEYEDAMRVIRAGFSSVMIDASAYDYEENIRRTKLIASIAHERGLSVEGELGHVGSAVEGDNGKLDFERLKELKDILQMPLVLHGGSGAGEDNIRRAVEFGINKINVCTDLFKHGRQAMLNAAAENPGIDYMDLQMAGEEAMKDFIKKYMRLIGSSGKYNFKNDTGKEFD